MDPQPHGKEAVLIRYQEIKTTVIDFLDGRDDHQMIVHKLNFEQYELLISYRVSPENNYYPCYGINLIDYNHCLLGKKDFSIPITCTECEIDCCCVKFYQSFHKHPLFPFIDYDQKNKDNCDAKEFQHYYDSKNQQQPLQLLHASTLTKVLNTLMSQT